MKVALSLFTCKTDNVAQSVEREWSDIVNKSRRPPIRKEKDGPLYSPATFDPPRRLLKNVREVSMLVTDHDHDANFEQDLRPFRPYTFAAHSTWNHSEAEQRFRVIIPLKEPIPASEFPQLWKWASQLSGGKIDPAASDASRMFYVPVRKSETASYLFKVNQGEFLDWKSLDLSPVEPQKIRADTPSENGHAKKIDHLLQQATSWKNGEVTKALLNGDASAYGGDESRADLGLASRLAFVSGPDPYLLELMMCRSKLQRPKWFEKHYGDGRTYLQGLCEKALEGRTDFYNGNGNSTTVGEPAGLRFVRMSEVVAKPVDWLWEPYIALGALTIQEGPPGVGKSSQACALSAAITRGRGIAGMRLPGPGKVLLCSAEDSKAHVLRPRLDAAGADVAKVFALDGPLTLDVKGRLQLEASIIEFEPTLVLLDPFFAYTGGKVDIHRANEMRDITAALTTIAEKHNCAILAVRHLAKSRGLGQALNAGLGSIDLVAAARSVLLVGQDPDDQKKRAMVQIKNNLGPLGPSVGFSIEDGNFYWTGDSDVTAAKILSLGGNDEERSALDEAVQFLRDALEYGERETSEVTNEARRLGISDKTLRRAREKLNIKARREGLPGTRQRFLWSLCEARTSPYREPSREELAAAAKDPEEWNRLVIADERHAMERKESLA
jgi:hypothetical protein